MAVRANRSIRLLIVLLLMSGFVVGCSQKPREHWWQVWRQKTPTLYPPEFVPPPPAVASAGPGAEASPGILPHETLPPAEVPDLGIAEAAPARRPPAGTVNELQTVYFDYDSAQLRDEARQSLEANAAYLLAHPDLRVQLEGHCDERGTQEYNLSLGQRRADAAREYLVSRGVPAERLEVISYGEERPVAMGHTEEAWRQNRRAEFKVY